MKRSVLIALIAALGVGTVCLAQSDRAVQDLSVLPSGEAEEAGGPADPAEYLTLKWGQDVTPAMVERAKRQAAAIPQGHGAPWQLVGPSNIGSRVAGQRGIYRVTNGGKDWKLVLAPPNDTTGGIDLAIDPSNHNRIFAALWDHKRNNGARVYGGVGSGLYRSDDGGDSWTRLENIVGPVNSYDQTGTGLQSDPSLGRIGVAVAPSDPTRVYVVFGSPYGPDKGFYVSNDGGA